MKRRSLILAGALAIALVNPAAWGARLAPVTVSPGSAHGIESVGTPCPTFSWSAVADARGYEVVVYRAGTDDPTHPAIRTSIAGPSLSWTPPSTSCLELSGTYIWSVRAIGEQGVGEWSEGALFRVEAGPLVEQIAGALERALIKYLDGRGLDAPAAGALAGLIAEELDPGSSVATPEPADQDMTLLRGVIVPAAGVANRGSLFTDDPELKLEDTGTGMDDYTQLVLESPANDPDWAWLVSGDDGVMFLTSPALSDAIVFEQTGALEITTTVDVLETVSDVTVGGELDVGDLTVASVTTSLCGDASGASKVGRCISSLRYKEDVRDLGLGLETVLDLRPVEFRWREGDGGHDLGFIAEEVAALDPLLATYDENGRESGVKYRRLTALLTSAIQDLQATIDEQGRQIGRLEALVPDSP